MKSLHGRILDEKDWRDIHRLKSTHIELNHTQMMELPAACVAARMVEGLAIILVPEFRVMPSVNEDVLTFPALEAIEAPL